MKKRDSFVLYTSQRDAVGALSDVDAGRLFKAIYSYQLGEGLPELDPMPNLVFLMMRPILDRDAAKWEETARKRAEAGAKGGRAKASNASEREAEQAPLSCAEQNQATLSNAKQSQAQLSDAKQTKTRLANEAVIGIVTGIGIGTGTDRKNTYSASGDAPRTHDSTQKPVPKPKALLEGKRLESFNRFWKAYGWPKGKGGAEKAWAAIPELTDSLVDRICEAAAKEAAQRPALQARGLTPKWAQGWLNERRWEDDYEATQPQLQQRQGSLFAQTQGQPKSWDQMRYEKNLQAARAAYEQLKAEEQGLDAQEEEYEPERWTAEVVGEE